MSLYDMSPTAVANLLPDVKTEARAITRRQIEEWFKLCDRILDVHRNNFVFREPTARGLAEHGAAFKFAIRTSLLINALIADPDFNEAELASRLRIRIQQLEDAYNTFHDTLSEEQAEAFLKETFPE